MHFGDIEMRTDYEPPHGDDDKPYQGYGAFGAYPGGGCGCGCRGAVGGCGGRPMAGFGAFGRIYDTAPDAQQAPTFEVPATKPTVSWVALAGLIVGGWFVLRRF